MNAEFREKAIQLAIQSCLATSATELVKIAREIEHYLCGRVDLADVAGNAKPESMRGAQLGKLS